MICEVRVVGKSGAYDKTLVKFTHEGSWADALRFAADCIDQSPPEEVEPITGIRVREVSTVAAG